MKIMPLLRFTPLIAALTLAGCANFAGISSHEQSTTTATDLALTPIQMQWPDEQWWKSYNDPILNALITQALAQNPSIKLAQARMARVSAITQTVRAASLPDVGLGVSTSREHYTENGLYPPPFGGSTLTNNTLMVNASYEFDFWGKNRAALDSAISTEQASKAEVSAARILIASSVAKSYFSMARAIEQQKTLRATLELREELRSLTQQRLAAGLDTQIELHQSEGTLPAIESELIQQDEQISLARHALAALIGVGPEAMNHIAAHFPASHYSTILPDTIPADLIGRRADISAARARVFAASKQIDVAKTAFYPNINLTLFAGYTGFGFSQWLDQGSRDYGGGPAITLPIFDAGRLRANLREKNAGYDAAVESYNQTLIEAVRDVADQLSSLHSLALQDKQQAAMEIITQETWRLAKQRESAGLVSKINVLNAESAVLAQRRTAIDLHAKALDSTINLNRALGGGFHEQTLISARQTTDSGN